MKIKIRRGVNQTGSSCQIRERTKWIHLDRCKVYQATLVSQMHSQKIHPSISDALPEAQLEEVEISVEEEQASSQDSEFRVEQPLQMTLCDDDDDMRASELRDEPVYSETDTGRRYPSRVRKPKQYSGEFVPWDQVSKRNRERTSCTNEILNRSGNERD